MYYFLVDSFRNTGSICFISASLRARDDIVLVIRSSCLPNVCVCNSPEHWLASGVRMHTMVNVSRGFIILCFLMLATLTSCEKTPKSCVDLQFTSGSEDNVVQQNEEGDVHVSFVISDSCKGSPTRTLVKLSTYGTDRVVDMCTVVFYNNTCNVTDRQMGQHCFNTDHNSCSISWKVKTSDKLLKLRLTDLSTKEDTIISLNITGYARKNPETLEIFGICCGVVVAVIIAAVVVRRWIFRGITESCARKLQSQVKEDRQTTFSNVAVRQIQRNSCPSSGRQAHEDIQARPSSLQLPGSQQQVNHQTISSIPGIPKRKRRVYDHIVQPSVTVARTIGDVYNHIQPSTHKTLSSQKDLYSYTERLDDTATRSKSKIHRHAPLSRDIVATSEADLYNHSTSLATATPGSKKQVLSHRNPNPSNNAFTRNLGQLQIHNTSSSQTELRSPEQLYKHAIPSRRSVGSTKSDTGYCSIVSFKKVPPIKQRDACNNDTLSSCTVARSLEQLRGNNDKAKLPKNYRRQVAGQCTIMSATKLSPD